LYENVTILIVKIATNRSTIELVNGSIGIKGIRRKFLKRCMVMARKEKCWRIGLETRLDWRVNVPRSFTN
jgi:hypothetical protein